jgi:transposase
MDVIKDDAKAGFRRIEVLTGPGRRRRWSDDEKVRVVGETLQPGVSVTEVARRWEICPQQVWGWRRQVREGQLMAPEAMPSQRFIPIVTQAPPPAAAKSREAVPGQSSQPPAASCIEIRLSGAVVRVPAGANGALLAEVLRAVRASAR